MKAGWDQPGSNVCASLWGDNSGDGKPCELEENVSAMETQAVLVAAFILAAE